MKENFDLAMQWILQAEGGYVNDPYDSGGETNMGISKRSYPNIDIKNLTKEQAAEIYKRDYWDKASCNELSSGIDIIVFDSAVNLGVKVADDIWVRAIFHYGTASFSAIMFLRYRIYTQKVEKHPSLSRYLKGWNFRLLRLERFCRENGLWWGI